MSLADKIIQENQEFGSDQNQDTQDQYIQQDDQYINEDEMEQYQQQESRVKKEFVDDIKQMDIEKKCGLSIKSLICIIVIFAISLFVMMKYNLLSFVLDKIPYGSESIKNISASGVISILVYVILCKIGVTKMF